MEFNMIFQKGILRVQGNVPRLPQVMVKIQFAKKGNNSHEEDGIIS